MNICINCAHIRRREVSGLRATADYNATCAAFDENAIPTLDPVFGIPAFTRKNSLGQSVHFHSVEEARPTCRTVNVDGRCDHFTRKDT